MSESPPRTSRLLDNSVQALAIRPMDYFFGDHQRWVGWFENPNHFSAWLALVAPWVWALAHWALSFARAKSRWGWLAFGVSWVLDVAVLIALAGTYSRGGWVAWICAAVAWMGFVNVWRRKTEAIGMGLRVMIAAASVFLFSAHERLDPAGWGEDRSVGNRLELWQGAAQMIADRPWTGWGAGQSGWVYCEAYQPVEREELYRTCVNSYLTLGAEHGLWLLMLMGGAAIAPLGRWRRWVSGLSPVPRRSTRRWTLPWPSGGCHEPSNTSDRGIWQSAAVASWAAWAVANVFSTLIEVHSLWPWAAVVAVVAFACLPWRRCARVGVAGALLGGVLVMGVAWVRPAPVDVESGDGWWRFTAGTDNHERTPWLIMPDERVLGLVAGREARRLALTRPDLVIWLPQAGAPFVDRQRLDEARSPVRTMPIDGWEAWAKVWLLGASAPPSGVDVSSIWRLHPLGWPADDEALVAGIMLPQWAGTGELLAWRRWAAARAIPTCRSGVAGTDVRSRWPDVIDIGFGGKVHKAD